MVESFRIELVDKDIVVQCKPEDNVLKAIERGAGGRFMVGCRFGGCGFCRVQVLEGEYSELPMSASYVSEEDRKNNIVLTCRIHPLSDMKLRYLGQYGE